MEHPMPTVELEEPEWNQVVSIIAQAPWTVANPLLTKISQQLRMQKAVHGDSINQQPNNHPTGDGEDRPLPGNSARPR